MAAHLANRVPSKKEDYVQWARKEWDWFAAQGFIGENNTINDGLLDNCGNNGATVYDYFFTHKHQIFIQNAND